MAQVSFDGTFYLRKLEEVFQRELDVMIKDSVEKFEQHLRKQAANAVMDILSFYEVTENQGRIVISVKTETKDGKK